ncbi:sigma factor-like helix-turn-helix DNA-binding protein, partial [Sphingopyxis sp. SCN 67-31]
AAIARNAAIDWRRSAEARGLLRQQPIDDALSLRADEGAGPEALLDQRDSRATIDRCLAALDARAAGFLRTAFFEGLSYRELAAREALPLGTIKSIIRRSLVRLRACLGDV